MTKKTNNKRPIMINNKRLNLKTNFMSEQNDTSTTEKPNISQDPLISLSSLPLKDGKCSLT